MESRIMSLGLWFPSLEHPDAENDWKMLWSLGLKAGCWLKKNYST